MHNLNLLIITSEFVLPYTIHFLFNLFNHYPRQNYVIDKSNF